MFLLSFGGDSLMSQTLAYAMTTVQQKSDVKESIQKDVAFS